MTRRTPRAAEPEPTKRHVTMSSVRELANGELYRESSEDWVHERHLEAYVEDARLKWQNVQVDDEPAAGPGGYHGMYSVPAHLAVADRGQVLPETPEDQR